MLHKKKMQFDKNDMKCTFSMNIENIVSIQTPYILCI